MSKLVKRETEKELKEVVEEIQKKAGNFNFIIRDIFDMAHEFRHHGVEVSKEFEYYSIMICNPEKAYKSTSASLVRGAILLPPKQVVVYRENGKTIIAYASVEENDIRNMLPDDVQFQEGLPESCKKIVELINSID